MKVTLKTEDNLASIHNQLMGLMPLKLKVFEFGCGKRNLLFKLSTHIMFIVGIDKSRSHIQFIKLKKKLNNIQNIDFVSVLEVNINKNN